MGYELHIHRADEWYHCDRQPITAEEWLAVVAGDPELRLDPVKDPSFALWSGPCRYPGGTWFNWLDGRVFTKNPDRATVAKMLELARRLGARVQGDHGEFYNRPEDMPSEEEFEAARSRFRHAAGWWTWAGRAGCVLAGLAILLVFMVGVVTSCRWLWPW
jgi:hypothetical protein